MKANIWSTAMKQTQFLPSNRKQLSLIKQFWLSNAPTTAVSIMSLLSPEALNIHAVMIDWHSDSSCVDVINEFVQREETFVLLQHDKYM